MCLAAPPSSTPSFDVHCREDDEDLCDVKESLRIEGPSRLNFLDARTWNYATEFRLQSSQLVTHIPDGIFQRFPRLSQVEIRTNLVAIKKDDFNLAGNLEILKLENNQIKVLPTKVFESAKKLTRLELPRNGIETIEDQAFKGLSKLENLHLNDNSLVEIKQYTFAGADNLEGLFLQNNKIESIAEGAFNFPNLRTLDLEANRIWTLPNGLFATTPNLVVLDLADNNLRAIGQSLYTLQRLERLNLNNNPDANIDFKAVAQMPKLKRLSLRKTGTVVPETLAGIKVVAPLQHLDLASNNISASNIVQRLKVFNKLDTLSFEYNHLRQVDGLATLRADFPRLQSFILGGNYITCTDYDEMAKTLQSQDIDLLKYEGVCGRTPTSP